MDCAKLQQQLGELNHLLPLQKDWFSRLLFQLSFNDIEIVQVLGATASGKSTLALALAELLSEQANVALLTAMPESQAIAAIQQQWFGSASTDTDLTAQVLHYADPQELCLIIDDGQDYTAAFLHQLTALSVRCFIFATKTVVPAALTLTINQAVLADAEQLLAAERLSTDQLKQRLVKSNGNLYYLITGVAAENTVKAKFEQALARKSRNVLLLGTAIGVLLLTALAVSYYQFYPDNQPLQVAALPSAEPKIFTNLPALLDDKTANEQTNAEDDPAQPNLTQINSEFVNADKIVGNKAVENLNPATDITATSKHTDSKSASSIVSSKVKATDNPDNDAMLALPSELPTELPTKPTSVKLISSCHEQQLIAASSTESVLQLAVLSNTSAFKLFQADYSALSMLCYQRSWQGKIQLVVLLGPYADNKQALAARQMLPKKLAAAGSFVKSLKAVQAEIAAFSVSQQLSTAD